MDWEQLSKGFLNTIKNYGDIQQAKANIQGKKAALEAEMLMNQIKAKQNFLYNMQEKSQTSQMNIQENAQKAALAHQYMLGETEQRLNLESENRLKEKAYQSPYEQYLMKLFEQQGGIGGNPPDMNTEATMSQEVFGQEPGIKVNLGTTGPTVSNPQANNTYWIQQLTKKREYGIQKKGDPFAYFTDTEKKWWNKEMMGKETPTLWDLQKEARTTVNSMLQNNPELQGKVFENPTMLTDLIDAEVARLQGRYMEGKNISQKEVTSKIPADNKRQKAIDYLTENKAPVTENNIKYVIGQMKNQ